ncbi:DNA repair helicase [Gonapodya prolifera JEL478]|uniref:ATP-dependent DNA helicase CHL1 n=1 Tax=Gonapodya prolifera (strain JEL478) TaxID=1344416 RepID=A0A139AAF9_GONPJ|nr:DNA repair helicase [Gonapodya prolifera JEL478]|eukprot:KXS13688.1 DNA repair helicase [Gonapodya prolifera JEL478]
MEQLLPLSRGEFPLFPYDTPYAVQLRFMQTLYNGIESRKKVILLESPTGTGKTLSLLCSSVQWLHDNEARARTLLERDLVETGTAESSVDDSDEPEWVRAHEAKIQKESVKRALKEQREKEEARIMRVNQIRSAPLQDFSSHEFRRKRIKKAESDKEEDSTALIVEYCSEDEDKPETTTDRDNTQSVQPLKTQILFCSRTHSQLNQVVGELKRLKSDSLFPGGLRVASLGSRRNMCINENLKRLTLPRLNDRCLDLQKDGKDSCPYYLPKIFPGFSDHLGAQIRDIEEIVELGESLRCCPYYGVRTSVTDAHIVTLPYNVILDARVREATGIAMGDQIVIFDEAHNLVDAITQVESVSVTMAQLRYAHQALTSYFDRYKNKLNGTNVMYISQILSLLNLLINHLRDFENKRQPQGTSTELLEVVHVPEFTQKLNFDQFNVFKLHRFVKESRLSQKLLGFVNKSPIDGANEGTDEAYVSSHVSPLALVEEFLIRLMLPSENGRVFIKCNSNESSYKYFLLTPSDHFEFLVGKARTVILAGGTMEPLQQMIGELFPRILKQDITIFQCKYPSSLCGHIVPTSNVLVHTVAVGPTGKELNFAFEHRDDPNLLNELAFVLSSLTQVIPEGVVVFMPSFSYLRSVMTAFEAKGFLARLRKRKAIFVEPKDAGKVDIVLADYAKAINAEASGGAILFAVVGGKLSEGINFSDHLGRAVIMCGVPFPNIQSPELRAKVAYLERRGNTSLGREYYENMAMKAVNQSIGRSLRHKDDYAAIILLDKRYSQDRIVSKLPKWIAGITRKNEPFGGVISSVAKFFKARAPSAH